MPVKNKIHNTQKAEGFPFETRPGSWTERMASGACFYKKKGDKHSKKRAARPRFVLFLSGMSDVREHKLLRKRQFTPVLHRKRHIRRSLMRSFCVRLAVNDEQKGASF